MTAQPFQPDDSRFERLEELLCDKAVQGLSAAEEAELRLLRAELGVGEDDAIEHAAAAAMLAMTAGESVEPMPDSLRARLDARAADWCRGQGDLASKAHELQLVAFEPKSPAENDAKSELATGQIRFGDRVYQAARSLRGGGGVMSAAACLTLAAFVATWNNPVAQTGLQEAGLTSTFATAITEAADSIRTLAENSPVARYDELLSSGRNVVAAHAAAPLPTPQPISAEFLWEPGADRGFIRVSGLAATADRDVTYQAWVYDQSRPEPYPVDAGTFDIPHEGGTYIIPVSARLPVLRPAAFAVTLERAGGVVVSAPERVLLVGEVAGQEVEFIGPPSEPSFGSTQPPTDDQVGPPHSHAATAE